MPPQVTRAHTRPHSPSKCINLPPQVTWVHTLPHSPVEVWRVPQMDCLITALLFHLFHLVWTYNDSFRSVFFGLYLASLHTLLLDIFVQRLTGLSAV